MNTRTAARLIAWSWILRGAFILIPLITVVVMLSARYGP